MKRCKDCKFWQFCKHFAKESDTFGYWRLTQGALGQCDQYCCKWWKTNRFLLAVIATLLIILLAVLLGGCSSKTYHRQAFDLQGNLTESVKITLTECVMHSEAEQIYVEFDGAKRKLIIGKFTQWPDAATVQAIAVGFRPWWIGLWGL